MTVLIAQSVTSVGRQENGSETLDYFKGASSLLRKTRPQTPGQTDDAAVDDVSSHECRDGVISMSSMSTATKTITEPTRRRLSRSKHTDDSSAAKTGLKRSVSSIRRAKYKLIPTAHIRPGHTQKCESLLSEVNSPSYSGFMNLAIIVLLVSELRLVLHDYRHDGLSMTLFRLGISRYDTKWLFFLTAAAPIHLFIALAIEKVAAYSVIKHNKAVGPKYLWSLYATLHLINCFLVLTITSAAVYWKVHHPVIGTICECHAIILCMKIASYALVNRDLRYLIGSTHVPDMYHGMPYPENLTLNNLVYFWWAPTLMYQPLYPRSEKIRPKFVAKCLGQMVFTAVLIWLLAGQFAIPALKASLPSFQQGDVKGIFESLLQLSGVSIVIWLLGFFFLFQSFLNLLAELLRFGDRDFYQDWWNAGSVSAYWRLWNKPVTNYFKRHIYIPLLRRGYHPAVCGAIVFFVSAVLHEMLVGIPTRQIIGVAFACMLLQIPLVFITDPLERMRGPATTIGNYVFWLSFFLGQPFAVLIYYYAWNVKYGVLRED